MRPVAAGHPFPWDPYSDQPAIVRSRRLRRRLRGRSWADYATTAAWGLTSLPLLALRAATLPRLPTPTMTEMLGVGISPLDQDPLLIRDLLDELGCRHVLARFELRRMHRWPELLRHLQSIGRPTLAVLIQDRAAVINPRRWRAACRAFYHLRSPIIEAVQAGHAINRLKWGCASTHEFAPLAAIAAHAHQRQASDIPFISPGTIDFEPATTFRSVCGHPRHWQADALGSALYVDRRGGPSACQYAVFNLERKITTLAAIAAISPHIRNHRLWITEFNWPLAGTAPYAPTSDAECVSETQAAEHILAYLRIAQASGKVQRCYVWQLLAKGYGLIDHSSGYQRPAWHALKQVMTQP
ncbi:MAG: hypothetical protein EA401_10260 [Planctomycetota bacterium]|nr:MAG: hypothetical protein EA401_10260 [Planctomycetota bacterium]